ncbi:class I glutamine amidotransferase-like protein [Neurospora hispaniola]|uniref:Class I glutamine amidotransferase-like protein n=1 Tax=Neurospora hispaniola TaxID=588809 RepID=A0AAJ0IA83_9PEZI|nr:class I glutamine amidotransferase-like protein [Neurospora hispaniola]
MTASTDSPRGTLHHEVNPRQNHNQDNTNDTAENQPTKIPLRIAILLNSYRSPHISSIRDSYTRCFASLTQSPTCRFQPALSFFYPADNFYCCPQGPHNERDGCYNDGGGNNGGSAELSDGALSSDCSNGFGGRSSSDDSESDGGPKSEATRGTKVDAKANRTSSSRMKEFLPDPAEFDLIVIGGGNADPRKRHAWILRVHEFLGVTDSKLTPAGLQFFNDRGPPSTAGGKAEEKKSSLRLHQHHRRQLVSTPPNFHQLLANNECLLSHDNSVLTFQGHPEKDAKAAKLKIRDAARWWGWDLNDPKAMEEVNGLMEREHDGNWVWERVLEWVWEGLREEGEGDKGNELEWKL